MANDSEEQTSRPILIAILGFADAKEQAQVTTLFARAKHWQRPWLVVPDAQHAEVLLMPADTPQEQAQWHNYGRQFSESHLIAYAEQPFEEAQWHLHRRLNEPPPPLEFTILLKRIGEALAAEPEEKRQQKVAAAIKDGDPYFDREVNFTGILRDLAALGGYAEIKAINTPALLIAAAERRYAVSGQGKLQQLHPLFALRRDHVFVTFLEAGAFDDRAKSETPEWRPLEQLLWYAAIHGSRGRLPKGHEDKNATVTLKEWPAYAADLPLFSDYLPIAAALHRHVVTLEKVAQITGASLAQVADFCNACESLGLLSWEEETYIPHPVEHPVNREELKMISRRLKVMRKGL
jgi:hypothetical protein